MNIARIVQTCEACPSQWEGYLTDGRAFYVRFRYGHLRMSVHPTYPLADDADVVVEEYDEGDRWAGDMPYEQLRDLLRQSGIEAPDLMDSSSKFHRHIVPSIAALGR